MLLISLSLLILFSSSVYAHRSTHRYHHGPDLKNYPPAQIIVHQHYVSEPTRSARQHYYVDPISYRVPGTPVYNRGQHNDPTFANAIGAVIGGLAGSKIGKGSGKLATTAAGTMFGYFLGGRLVSPE